MNNNKQSSVEWFAKESWNLKVKLENKEITIGEYGVTYVDLLNQAKAMQKQQAEHYATFIINCVNNNLPTITFNDWINSHNNEQ